MRNVVGDDAIDGLVDAMVEAGRVVAVGLLVGRLSSGGRDFVLGLAQTPVKEDGNDAAALLSGQSRTRSGQGSVALSIDVEWVAEHARQVSRMLLGGVSVVGIYCLAPDNSFKHSVPILCQVSKAVNAVLSTSSSSKECLVLQISTSPRRLTCKACQVEGSGNQTLKLCEWKMTKVVKNLQVLACTYTFDASIPVPSAADPDSYKNILLSWTASKTESIQAAEVIVDNELQGGENLPENVRLFIPLDDDRKGLEKPTNIAGIINFKGSVEGRAYAFPRDPAQIAIDAIKEDISASLRNRIEILCEEAEQLSPEQAVQSLLSNCKLNESELASVLPKRVLLPWNGLLVSDYQLPSETDKELKERFSYIFSEASPAGDIVPVEQFFAPPLGPKPSKLSSPKNATTKGKISSLIGILFGILVPIVLALAVALFWN